MGVVPAVAAPDAAAPVAALPVAVGVVPAVAAPDAAAPVAAHPVVAHAVAALPAAVGPLPAVAAPVAAHPVAAHPAAANPKKETYSKKCNHNNKACIFPLFTNRLWDLFQRLQYQWLQHQLWQPLLCLLFQRWPLIQWLLM